MTRKELVSRYADKMGISIEHIDFYHVFGLFRLSVIAQQIYYRFHHGQTSNPAYGEFRDVVRERWLPALLDFRPQMLFVSAGFDAHREDPLAGLKLGDADYSWVTRELCYVANKHANGRIVSTLEGGYALSALGRTKEAREEVKRYKKQAAKVPEDWWVFSNRILSLIHI